MSIATEAGLPRRPDAARCPNPYVGRRVLFGALVLATLALMTGLMVVTLSRGGFGLLDLLFTLCFLVTLPWTLVGFWNAVIGLVLLRAAKDPVRAVCPLAAVPVTSPIRGRTAILMCVRNEDAAAVARHLEVMIDGLAAAGASEHFALFILSDSDEEDVIAEEAQAFGTLADRRRDILPVTYRRRAGNPGFKAGNIGDFCERWGHAYDFALPLDADSLMSARAVLRLVRTMEADPGLGILQSLVVGMPTPSPFARVFQFGMRLGMRSYTLGSAWWQGDCGPYWGHNALIRLAPFIAHCRLPKLAGGPPLGGWILSHDQVEAVLMRRAGFEVRVLPLEDGSWEENPPTLLQFIRRDLRWCRGNMQYLRLLGMPGLRPVSRVQLALAILMFAGSPFWIAFMTLAMLRVGTAEDPGALFHPETGLLLFSCIMLMVFAPKIASLVDALASAAGRRAFGGGVRLIAGFFGEVVFTALMAPVMAMAHTRFLVGLPFGRVALWPVQRRGAHGVTFRQGLARLWPQTLFGAAAVLWLVLTAPPALIGFLPFLAGPVLAVPIAVISAREGLGRRLARLGLWRIPDETAPAPELRALELPALAVLPPAASPAAICVPEAGSNTA